MKVSEILRTHQTKLEAEIESIRDKFSSEDHILSQLHPDLDVRHITSGYVVSLEPSPISSLKGMMEMAPPLPMYKLKTSYSTVFSSKERYETRKGRYDRDYLLAESLEVSPMVFDVSRHPGFNTEVRAKWDHQLRDGKIVSLWADITNPPWELTFSCHGSRHYGFRYGNAKLQGLPPSAQFTRWSSGGPKYIQSFTVWFPVESFEEVLNEDIIKEEI